MLSRSPQVKCYHGDATVDTTVATASPKSQVQFVSEDTVMNTTLGNANSEINFAEALQLAKYTKPNLSQVLEDPDKYGHLSTQQKSRLLEVLTANDRVFQGKRGNYTGKEATIHLVPDAIPFWAKPYPIPLKNREVTEK